MTSTNADLYLRLSDLRDGNDTFESRERKLRAFATGKGLTVARVVVENDAIAEAKGRADGRSRPASAFKRVPVMGADGSPLRDPVTKRIVKRVYRPGWQSIIARLANGQTSAIVAEDLDRTARDPRDIEDLIDACEARGGSAYSISGSLSLTSGGNDMEVSQARGMVNFANLSSRTTARRVRDSRERRAEAGSYGGGRRPFGYRPVLRMAGGGPATLAVVEHEAELIRAAATAALADVSLRAIARDWRERGIPTVTGAVWTPDTVRGVLMSYAIAGLAAHTKVVKENGSEPRKVTTLHPAGWPAIISPELRQALEDKFNDPSRCTSPGNEARWLVSGIAVCGQPGCGESVYSRTSGGRPSYVCRGPKAHLRRVAPATDSYVSAVVVERLSRPDAADLFRPAARPGIDTAALRQERAALAERKSALARMFAAGDLDDSDMLTARAELKRRLDSIDAQLHESTAPDPLAELRDVPDVAGAWEALSLPRRRAIVRLLMNVTIKPGQPGAPRRFDPASIEIDWLAA